MGRGGGGVRATRMERVEDGEVGEQSVSSSVCEVTEGLPGWSPAFSLEIPGLHSRKEPALFMTWPEPSLAPSPPCQGLGGAARPGLPLWRTTSTTSLWPLSAQLTTTCARHAWPSRKSAPSSIRPTASAHCGRSRYCCASAMRMSSASGTFFGHPPWKP